MPSAAAVSSVKSWLAAAGMKVTSVEHARRYVVASGSTSAAEKAFGTSLERFRHRKQLVRAPADTVSVPAAVAGKVLTITGLDTTAYRLKPKAKQPPAFVNARPCSSYYGQVTAKFQADFKTPLPPFMGAYRPYAVCGYTPNQFRSAYEGGTTRTGKGVTVGVVDAYASPSIVKDANKYATTHGDAAFGANQYTETAAKPFTHKKECDNLGWYGEETLDVEAVHGMAPGAKVHYYGGQSCLDEDLDTALAQLVDDNDVDMVSNSYGDLGEDVPTDEVVAFESIVLQGERQGISFMFSSGDDGDEVAGTGTKQPDFSASDPYVTAVGGTATAIDAAGKLQFQTGWGTDKYSLSTNGKKWDPQGFLYGAGGGFSQLFNRPSYQNGVVPGSFPAGRAVPDVAMDADPTTGMLVGETQEFPDGNRYGEYRIGGTSLASPLFTGFQALAAQTAGRQGFLNPTIYAQARAGKATFADVTPEPHRRRQRPRRLRQQPGRHPTGSRTPSGRSTRTPACSRARAGTRSPEWACPPRRTSRAWLKGEVGRRLRPRGARRSGAVRCARFHRSGPVRLRSVCAKSGVVWPGRGAGLFRLCPSRGLAVFRRARFERGPWFRDTSPG